MVRAQANWASQMIDLPAAHCPLFAQVSKLILPRHDASELWWMKLIGTMHLSRSEHDPLHSIAGEFVGILLVTSSKPQCSWVEPSCFSNILPCDQNSCGFWCEHLAALISHPAISTWSTEEGRSAGFEMMFRSPNTGDFPFVLLSKTQVLWQSKGSQL